VFIVSNTKVKSEMLCLIKENNIYWFFTYLILIYIVLLKDLIDLYIL
jgi:hypothetical protein